MNIDNGNQITCTMLPPCWRGQHPFDLDDIDFEQEIIADDGMLNFYVPIYFDALITSRKEIEFEETGFLHTLILMI